MNLSSNRLWYLLEFIRREDGALDLDQVEDDATGEVLWECTIDGDPELDASRVRTFYGKTPVEALAAAANFYYER